MATSSIFSNVKIADRNSATEFINAVIKAEKSKVNSNTVSSVPSISKEQIKEILVQKKK